MKLHEWQTLSRLTGGEPIEIERVRVTTSEVVIEGRFAPPPLAHLSGDDQIFVAAFVRCHGSIKQMERYFGVSYPTIKNRLNRLAAQLPFVEVEPGAEPSEPADRPSAAEMLSRLERGDVSVRDVLKELNAHSPKESL